MSSRSRCRKLLHGACAHCGRSSAYRAWQRSSLASAGSAAHATPDGFNAARNVLCGPTPESDWRWLGISVRRGDDAVISGLG